MKTQCKKSGTPQRYYWGLSYASGYFHLGMLDQAQQELADLGKKHQTDRDVLSLRGLILLARRQWSQVIPLAEQGIDLYPTVSDFYIQAAYSYERIDQASKAHATWMKAPPEVQASPLYHYNLARCQIRLGEHQQASQHIQQALKLAPDMLKTMQKDPLVASLIPVL